MTVSERVAAERGERIGQTVGYQVRLDSKLSPKTLLQYCTNGVLLRLLMVGHKCLSNITHIIVDEIHERDSFSDYLLISLRDLQKTYKKLKIILMSATLNVELFTNYFGNCPLINVPGNCYDVKTYFLEDLLKQTGYLNKGMRKMLQEHERELFKDFVDEYDDDEVPSKSTAASDVMKLLKKDSCESETELKYQVSVQSHESDAVNDGAYNAYDEEDYGEDVEIESDSEAER